MKAESAEVARIAAGLLDKPEIPYVPNCSNLKGMDCQGLVEYCIREAGAKIDYAGSNDMFRHACTWLGTLDEAKKQGKLIPGAILFMLERNGNEPAKYKSDGLGNASHVGVYVGGDKIYSVDASASAGKVRSRDKRNGEGYVWTHVGWFKEVDYMMIKKDRPTQTVEATPTQIEKSDENRVETVQISDEIQPEVERPPKPSLPKKARVTGSQRLNMRGSPRLDGSRIGGMEPGTDVEVLDGLGDWWKIRAQINGQFYTGWSLAKYLQS